MPETSHCAIHDVDEKVTAEGIVCFECKHSYKNEEEIVAEFLELAKRTKVQRLPEMVAALKSGSMNSEEITFCPICLHDW